MGALRSAIVSHLPSPVAKRLRAARRSLEKGWVDETEIIASRARQVLAPSASLLVDVGANCGTVTARFLQMGWSVVAYEPDPSNRLECERRVGANPRVQLSAAAVSDKPAKSVSLFTSPVSTGISTLASFHESHKATAKVDVVTLAEDLNARGIDRVDFLKVDVEGFDFFVLKGFDWTCAPRFVLYEFEDRKTIPLGYSLADSSNYATERGYHLVYSVWEPIVEYGQRHHWRGLFLTPPPDVAQCWGNVMCFREQVDADYCLRRFGSRLHRAFGAIRHG